MSEAQGASVSRRLAVAAPLAAGAAVVGALLASHSSDWRWLRWFAKPLTSLRVLATYSLALWWIARSVRGVGREA